MAGKRQRRGKRQPIRFGGVDVIQIGTHRHFLGDFYHYFLDSSWITVLLVLLAVFAVVNMAFALAYLECGNCIENARTGSFEDAFFFSVQTLATIGYGKLVPRGTAANLLVAFEAVSGLLGFAIVTGLAFAKFSRPTARVMFSKYAIVLPRDGVESLQFRMGNERSNRIVEAQIHVSYARQEVTVEGESIRRISDLKLVRDRSSVFAISWTALHQISADSPLYGETSESLIEKQAEIVVSLVGIDETLAQTIHARHAYSAADLAFGARFVDIMAITPDGHPSVDYTHFHEIEYLEPEARRKQARSR